MLKEGVSFTEHRLQGVIAHEIMTHIYRLENGRRQPYAIFALGTAQYLATEEGLAIYNQKSWVFHGHSGTFAHAPLRGDLSRSAFIIFGCVF